MITNEVLIELNSSKIASAMLNYPISSSLCRDFALTCNLVVWMTRMGRSQSVKEPAFESEVGDCLFGFFLREVLRIDLICPIFS